MFVCVIYVNLVDILFAGDDGEMTCEEVERFKVHLGKLM